MTGALVAVGESRPDPVRSRLVGYPTPRVQSVPARGRSRGPQMHVWARDTLGIRLLPWQRHVLDEGCRVYRDRWQARTVLTLVARQNGKTLLTSVRVLAGMVLFGERLVVGAAQNRDIALEAWRQTLELAEDAGLEVAARSRTNGREEFTLANGARYKIVSSTRRGARGLSADLVVLDELREFRDWDGWAALDKTRRARRGSQVWAISTEGDAGSVVLNTLCGQAREAAESGRRLPSMAYFEWSAEPGRERSDRAGWAEANPALGRLLDVDTVAHELATDPPEVFETEVLCRRVSSLRPWLPEGMWDACVEPATSVPDSAAGRVVFALDCGPELRHASICVGWRRPDGRLHVEAVAGWVGAGLMTSAERRLRELVERWRPPVVLVVGRSAAESVARRAVEGTLVPVLPVTPAGQASSVAAGYEAVLSRVLVHPPDPLLATHVDNLQPGPGGMGGVRRRSNSADVDAAVGMLLTVGWLAGHPEGVDEPHVF